MGAVAMKERSTGLVDRGYPVVEATLYIYCDVCGSFSIKTYIPFFKLLVLAAIITTGVFLALDDKQWLGCIFPVAFLAVFLPWKDILLRYKCRKCGYAHIADYNSLHFQSYDLSVVDVPDKLTQKRYIDTDVLHFQQFTSINADSPQMANDVDRNYIKNFATENRDQKSPAQHSAQRMAGIPHTSPEIFSPQPVPNRTALHQRLVEEHALRWASALSHRIDIVNDSHNKMERSDIYNWLLYPEREIVRGRGIMTAVNKLTPDEYNILLTLLNHKKARVRWMAACRLGKIGAGRAVEPLIQALGDKHWKVRLHAVKALGSTHTPGCFDSLVVMIHDDCNYVRRATMNSLRKANLDKDPRVIEALLSVLQGSDKNSQVDVIEYLKDTPSLAVIDILTDVAFRDHENNVSREVLNAFATIGSSAITGVSKLLAHPNKDARYHAAIILGYQGDKRAIQYLESTFDDADPNLMERTKYFLTEFRKRYPEL